MQIIKMKKYLLSFSFLFLMGTTQLSFGQATIDVIKDPPVNGIGGELKGAYVIGSAFFTFGASLPFFAPGFNEAHGRVFSSFVTGGVVVAPASLVGLGIGALLAQKHSKFSRSFQLGTGVTISPIFLDEQKYAAGINIRILSTEIGKWRYSFGFDYFPGSYTLLDGTTRNSWAAINLNLHYLFSIGDSFRIYPFVGTQINDSTKKEIYTNFGTGVSYRFGQKWNLFGEFKLSFDPDKEPIRAIYSFGTSYFL
jgi:hypothetical protein